MPDRESCIPDRAQQPCCKLLPTLMSAKAPPHAHSTACPAHQALRLPHTFTLSSFSAAQPVVVAFLSGTEGHARHAAAAPSQLCVLSPACTNVCAQGTEIIRLPLAITSRRAEPRAGGCTRPSSTRRPLRRRQPGETAGALARSSVTNLQAASASLLPASLPPAAAMARCMMLCAAVRAAPLVSPAALAQGGQPRAPAAAQLDASLADGHARGHALHDRQEAGLTSRRQSLPTKCEQVFKVECKAFLSIVKAFLSIVSRSHWQRALCFPLPARPTGSGRPARRRARPRCAARPPAGPRWPGC